MKLSVSQVMTAFFAVTLALLGRHRTVQRDELHGSGGAASPRTRRTTLPTACDWKDPDARATMLADADSEVGWSVDLEADLRRGSISLLHCV